MIESFGSNKILDNIVLAFNYLYWFAPLWLPVFFFWSCFESFLRYTRSKFIQKEGSLLLEIKLPREINKSPLAMETALGAFHLSSGEATWINRIWEGKTRPWFSLEIASLEGKIRFFIWTRLKSRNTIESSLYSQYPGIEIHEVEDYTKPFYYDPNKTEIWACEFALTQPDPYPIKTYVDYGLEKDPKEEYKVDPLVQMLEFLGSLTEGQNVWFQIIIRMHRERRVFDVFSKKEDAWKNKAKEEVKKIIDKLKEEGTGSFPRTMTDGEKNKIAALERSISKFPFDVGIRAIYITDKNKFNPANIGGVAGAFKQYSSGDLNGFRPSGWISDFDYPWQEWFNKKEKVKPKVLTEYKLRRFFYSPWKDKKFHGTKPFILNTEELATIFHFPGEVAATPTLEKIPSVKSKAPSNLPI